MITRVRVERSYLYDNLVLTVILLLIGLISYIVHITYYVVRTLFFASAHQLYRVCEVCHVLS